MIVVDTSSLIALFLREPDSRAHAGAIFAADQVLVGAQTAFEFRMVAHGRRRERDRDAAQLVHDMNLIVEPWTEDLVMAAHAAFRRYGKGQGHPAQLNFGDCMSYALAKARDLPLLYKGGDFALTDIRSAL